MSIPADANLLDYLKPSRRSASKKINYNERQNDKLMEKRIKEASNSKSPSPASPVKKYTGPTNIIPTLPPSLRRNAKFSQILKLEGATVTDGVLTCSDGVTVSVGEDIYMISEPPGEPYYVGRVMEFVLKDQYVGQETTEAGHYNFKMNWFYRPRDITNKISDSRYLFCTMHSDTCPLSSFRGKCEILHKDEIPNELWLQQPNHFFFDKLFDRYSIKYFDMLCTATIPLPTNYKRVLGEKYRYVFVEQGRKFPAWEKCPGCDVWCCSSDGSDTAVECGGCHQQWHVDCAQLFKKPSRGFVWFCYKCGEYPEPTERLETAVPDFELAAQNWNLPLHKEYWSFRYLGQYVNLLGALDSHDSPYPRAVSRVGTKHQCSGIGEWPGRAVCYYDPITLTKDVDKIDLKKKKNEPSCVVSALKVPSDVDLDESPWWEPRPKGYIERGGDSTAELQWVWNREKLSEEALDKYIKDCAPVAESLSLSPTTPNFFDAILKILMKHNYSTEPALKDVSKLSRDTLKEPTLSPKEVAKFEEGVGKYGSELYPVYKLVKTQPASMIVRFYYIWKKTENGKRIWGSFPGRKKLKHVGDGTTTAVKSAPTNQATADDGRFIGVGKDAYTCEYCGIENSQFWYKVTSGSALCTRCARLWRRYAVKWEEPETVLKKKKCEYELLCDAELILGIFEPPAIPAPKRSRVASSTEPKAKRASRKKKEETKEELKSEEIPDTPEVAMNDTVSTTPESQVKEEHTPEVKEEIVPEISVKSLSDKLPETLPEALAETAVETKAEVPLEVPPLKRKQGRPRKSPDSAPTVPKEKKETTKSSRGRQTERELALRKSKQLKLETTLPDFNPTVSNRLYYSMNADYIHTASVSKSKTPDPTTEVATVASNQRGICCVCKEHCSKNEEVLCHNCGLNVHINCYPGVTQPTDGKRWLCQPCSNDLNPMLSTSYNCQLCHAREIDHDSAKKSLKSALPDALRREIQGGWVHCICTIFTPGVFVSNDAVCGVWEVLMRNNLDVCDICQLQGGGLFECNDCKQKVHITCAQDTPGYHIGFNLVPTEEKSSRVVTIGQDSYLIEPMARCGSCPETKIHPFQDECIDYQGKHTTLMSIYLDQYKTFKMEKNNLVHRVHERDSICDAQYTKDCDGALPPRLQLDYMKQLVKWCSRCSSSVSPRWWPCGENVECHECHMREKVAHPSFTIEDITCNACVLGKNDINDKLFPTVVAETTTTVSSN